MPKITDQQRELFKNMYNKISKHGDSHTGTFFLQMFGMYVNEKLEIYFSEDIPREESAGNHRRK